MKPAELFHVTGRKAVVVGGTGEPCGAMAEGFAAAGAQALSWSHATRNAVWFRITSDSLGDARPTMGQPVESKTTQATCPVDIGWRMIA